MWQCYSNNIKLVYLPPHSSHVLQPLDLSCFSSLKKGYRAKIKELACFNDAMPIKKIRFIQYYYTARKTVFTESNIKSGFNAAGLVPYDPRKVLRSSQVKQQR